MARDGIAMRLRHARKLRELTQDELAKASGIKQASISDLERGESRSFRGTTLVSLAQSLKVNPAWLAEGKGAMDGTEPPLPPEAMKVARNWLRLTPEIRSRVADMLDEMVKNSSADKEPAPDHRVEQAYGRPSKKSHDKNKK